MAVHVLGDPVAVQPGDCVIEGTPVGVTGLAVETALKAKARGATLVALTNVAFEQDPRAVLEHPTRGRLHELADIVVDLAGPVGDGVFEDPQTGIRVLPHSGVTGMTAMWMIFARPRACSRSVARRLAGTSAWRSRGRRRGTGGNARPISRRARAS
jgi:uncharacterized phosphosugar-binding protein